MDNQYINVVIESNPLRDQTFGKTIVLRRVEDVKTKEAFFSVDVDDVEWLRAEDFKRGLVLYNLMRTCSYIGEINNAYDEFMKKIKEVIDEDSEEDK